MPLFKGIQKYWNKKTSTETLNAKNKQTKKSLADSGNQHYNLSKLISLKFASYYMITIIIKLEQVQFHVDLSTRRIEIEIHTA